MFGGDSQRDPVAGLGVHGGESQGNWFKDLDGECGVERLVVGLRGAVSDDLEILVHR